MFNDVGEAYKEDDLHREGGFNRSPNPKFGLQTSDWPIICDSDKVECDVCDRGLANGMQCQKCKGSGRVSPEMVTIPPPPPPPQQHRAEKRMVGQGRKILPILSVWPPKPILLDLKPVTSQ